MYTFLPSPLLSCLRHDIHCCEIVIHFMYKKILINKDEFVNSHYKFWWWQLKTCSTHRIFKLLGNGKHILPESSLSIWRNCLHASFNILSPDDALIYQQYFRVSRRQLFCVLKQQSLMQQSSPKTLRCGLLRNSVLGIPSEACKLSPFFHQMYCWPIVANNYGHFYFSLIRPQYMSMKKGNRCPHSSCKQQ